MPDPIHPIPTDAIAADALARDRTADGWCLRFTGRDAHGELLDRVFDEIERLLGPV